MYSTNSQSGIDMYYDGKRINGWANITHRQIYLSKDNGGRSLWLTDKIKPNVKTNDDTRTIKISSKWKLEFKTQSGYNKAVSALSENYPKLRRKSIKRKSIKRKSIKRKSKH